MRKQSILKLDSRGASPVVGVILMVAVVVILAATVGSYVLTTQPPEVAPQSSIEVRDSSNNLTDVKAGEVRDLVKIEHDGGDPITNGSYMIRVNNPGNGQAELNTTAPARINTAADIRLVSKPTTFSSGDTLTVEIVSNQTGGASFTAVGTWRIAVIHQPSNSLLYDSDIRLE